MLDGGHRTSGTTAASVCNDGLYGLEIDTSIKVAVASVELL